MMDSERLGQIIDRFSSKKIAVIGDFFLDKYLDVDNSSSGVSLETGKKVNQVVNIHCSPGAVGNVVNNLAALQAVVVRFRFAPPHNNGFVTNTRSGPKNVGGTQQTRIFT